MNAPKKIYYDPYVGTANREWVVGDTTYIREDLVLELVEALETNSYDPGCNCDECKEIRDVIHKIKEESHD
jgi:hypothetical protein